jgi:hypothetical protein
MWYDGRETHCGQAFGSLFVVLRGVLGATAATAAPLLRMPSDKRRAQRPRHHRPFFFLFFVFFEEIEAVDRPIEGPREEERPPRIIVDFFVTTVQQRKHSTGGPVEVHGGRGCRCRGSSSSFAGDSVDWNRQGQDR